MLKLPEAGTFKDCPFKDTLAVSEFVQTGILRFKVESFPIPCKKIGSIRFYLHCIWFLPKAYPFGRRESECHTHVRIP